MDNYDDSQRGMRLLPGVDLALWLRIIVAVLAVLVGGLAFATF